MGHRLLSSKMYWKKSYLNREIGWKMAVDLEDRAGACRSIWERTVSKAKDPKERLAEDICLQNHPVAVLLIRR